MATIIQIDKDITVGDLADKLLIPVSKLITELMKNGIIATVNERIDFETAQIIVQELGLDVEIQQREIAKNTERTKKPLSETAASRPPVIAVMGHVDHGKTSLLDAIRGSQVVKTESGGITQHISAYQVEHNGKMITFLDTPGHEAFAALREHGARLTDIVIIVVAADDGVKPQTVEAIRFANKAGARMIVAINKIDKEGADSNRVKQQLAEHNLLVEEWGGDTIAVELSAKTGKGVPELLDMVLLVGEVENFRADIDQPASGFIIESHLEQGRGPMATALIESGTLHRGDYIVAGSTYAKVRVLENTSGKPLESAGPSTPVNIAGFKQMPEFAEEFVSVKDEKAARVMVAQTSNHKQQAGGKININSGELLRMINRNRETSELNVIIKADVQGSLTSVVDSLKALDTDEVAVKIIAGSIGPVNDSDISLAQSTSAIIYGFNVNSSPGIKNLADRYRVNVRFYKIIYELIDDVKEEMSKLLAPEVVENELGRLIVRGIFKNTKSEVICGGEVTKGKLSIPSYGRIDRGGENIAEVEITNLKRGPTDVKEIQTGEMCGLSFKPLGNRVNLELGDHIELFTREVKVRSI